MRRLTTILLIAVWIAIWTAVSGAADATVIISQGLAGGSGDVDKVRFDDPSLILQGNPVTGLTRSGIRLVISSDEGLVVNLPGRSTIGAVDGGFNTITVAISGADAFKVQFALDPAGAGANGDIRITMTDDQSAESVAEFLAVGPGAAFYTGIASAGRSITGFTIAGLGEGFGSTPAEFAALGRLRVGATLIDIGGDSSGGSANGGGGSGGNPGGFVDILAPGALGLLAFALAGLGLYRLTRRGA